MLPRYPVWWAHSVLSMVPGLHKVCQHMSLSPNHTSLTSWVLKGITPRMKHLAAPSTRDWKLIDLLSVCLVSPVSHISLADLVLWSHIRKHQVIHWDVQRVKHSSSFPNFITKIHPLAMLKGRSIPSVKIVNAGRTGISEQGNLASSWSVDFSSCFVLGMEIEGILYSLSQEFVGKGSCDNSSYSEAPETKLMDSIDMSLSTNLACFIDNTTAGSLFDVLHPETHTQQSQVRFISFSGWKNDLKLLFQGAFWDS